MSAVPAATPVTAPLAEVTVATAALPVVHVPPVTVLMNSVAAPAHTSGVPVMAGGSPVTVTVVDIVQPVSRP